MATKPTEYPKNVTRKGQKTEIHFEPHLNYNSKIRKTVKMIICLDFLLSNGSHKYKHLCMQDKGLFCNFFSHTLFYSSINSYIYNRYYLYLKNLTFFCCLSYINQFIQYIEISQ